MECVFKPMDEPCARRILAWSYPPPYDLYNADLEEFESALETMLDPEHHYFSATLNGTCIGFRCFGADARVAGGTYSDDALDTGGGLHPDHTGRGYGRAWLLAGLNFGRAQFKVSAFRVTVAAFNVRALKVVERASFLQTEFFTRTSDGRSFYILTRSEAV